MDFEISAILTTYRRPELARRALESILAQTFPPSQILVVEDGGKTWLSDWLSEQGRPDIEYVGHDENRGLAAARNTGLSLARHSYIAYLDDDDFWLPTRLEEQVQCWLSIPIASRGTLAAVQVGCQIVDERERHVGSSMPFNQGRLRESIMNVGASTPSSSFLFAGDALRSIGGFDETLISGIDHDIWMKLAVAGYSSAGVAKLLVRAYKDARQSMMSNTDQRIAGVDQYVLKWAPTYEDWFGINRGQVYAKRYAIRVISRLAGEKLACGHFREFLKASRAVFSRAGKDFTLVTFAVAQVTRSSLIAILQRFRATMRSFFDRNAHLVRI